MSYRRPPTCRYCYDRGHTKRSCPSLAANAAAAAVKPTEERTYQEQRAVDLNARNVRTASAPRLCSYCGFEGHNRKGCKHLKGDIERYNALNARWWRGLRANLNSAACKTKVGALVTWRTWDGFVFHAIVVGLGKGIRSDDMHVAKAMDSNDVARFFLSATLLSSTVPQDDRRRWMPNEGDTINIAAIGEDIVPVGVGNYGAVTLVSEGIGNIEIPEDWGVNADCSWLFQPAKSKRVTFYYSNGRPDFDAIEQFLKNFNA
jgi:hypothetical protein